MQELLQVPRTPRGHRTDRPLLEPGVRRGVPASAPLLGAALRGRPPDREVQLLLLLQPGTRCDEVRLAQATLLVELFASLELGHH